MGWFLWGFFKKRNMNNKETTTKKTQTRGHRDRRQEDKKDRRRAWGRKKRRQEIKIEAKFSKTLLDQTFFNFLSFWSSLVHFLANMKENKNENVKFHQFYFFIWTKTKSPKKKTRKEKPEPHFFFLGPNKFENSKKKPPNSWFRCVNVHQHLLLFSDVEPMRVQNLPTMVFQNCLTKHDFCTSQLCDAILLPSSLSVPTPICATCLSSCHNGNR